MAGSGSCPTVLLPNTTSVADFGLWAKAGAATNVARAKMVARVFISRLRVEVGYRWDRVYTARDKPAVNCVTSGEIFWTTSTAGLEAVRHLETRRSLVLWSGGGRRPIDQEQRRASPRWCGPGARTHAWLSSARASMRL